MTPGGRITGVVVLVKRRSIDLCRVAGCVCRTS